MALTGPTSGVRPTILIVDDIPANLVAFEAMLRKDDIEIVTASSGAAALEILLQREVALAIIDVQMPEMDGFALAELMRGVERTRYVPIIFVTAGVNDTARIFQGYEAGAVDFLFKPVEPHVLRGKVEVFATLERHRQRLRDQDRMREMFIGILGHDLRNPLSGITMAAHLVLSRSKDEALREPLERIVSSAQRMGRMVEQLLDLTRLRLGDGIALHPRICELRGVVQEVLAESDVVRQRARLEVTGGTAGMWDRDRLLQVVSNLVGNAVQHGTAGTPRRTPSRSPCTTTGRPSPRSFAPCSSTRSAGRARADAAAGSGSGCTSRTSSCSRTTARSPSSRRRRTARSSSPRCRAASSWVSTLPNKIHK
jgi:signal transduction histidine kinase